MAQAVLGGADANNVTHSRLERIATLVSLLGVLSVGLFIAPARAQTDPVQYVATVWQTEQGLPQNSVSAIAQDRDGYLWVATGGGLARFDGVRFRIFGANDIPGLRSGFFRSLHASNGGDLWIGSNNGVTRLQKGVFTTSGGSIVTSLNEDRAGKIWINTLQGVACCAGEEIKSYTSYRGKPVREFLLQARDGSMWFRSANDVVRFGADGSVAFLPGGVMAGEARDGSVWIAGPSRLVRYDKGAFSDVPLPTGPVGNWVGTQPWQSQLGMAADPHQVVLAMAADTDGELLLLTPAGFVRTADGKLGTLEPLPAPANSDHAIKVQSLFVDRDGNRWVGTLGRGLIRFRRAPLTAYTKENGLSDSPFRTVFQDRESRIWLGGDDALYWYDRRAFHLLPGLSEISTIAQTPDGDLWFGGSGALYRLHSGVLTRYPLDTPAINQLLVDRDGTLWVDAPNRTLSRILYRFRDGNFEKVESDVLRMSEDVDGGLWLALYKPPRLRYVRAGNNVEYGAAQGLPQTGAYALRPDRNGALWFSTASGLHRLRDGKFSSITARNGLTTDIVAILIDGQNILWLPSNQGIFRLTLKEANDLADGRLSTISPFAYGLAEGMKISECNTGSPGAVQARDGRLWFPTMRGVVAIDPNLIGSPPPVIVEEARADRTVLAPGGHTVASAGNNTFEFRFTALDLSAPERQRFNYRLDPYDKDWVEAGTLRVARYTNMAPGEYSFHVIAANSFGIWNERGATVSFALQPHDYQRSWFRALCALGVLVLLWLAYQFRVRQLAYQFKMRLDERVQERTRIARELHDTLLQSFQGVLPIFQAGIYEMPDTAVKARKTFEEALDLASRAIAEGRDAVQALRMSTLEKNDLAGALRTLRDEIVSANPKQHPPTFRVVVEGTSRDLHPIVRNEVSRIAAEALRNAFMHAAARTVEIELRYDDNRFRLRVRDDGKGIRPETLKGGREKHYGLQGMEERAKIAGGKLTIGSEVDNGTEIELVIPASKAYVKSARRFLVFGKHPKTDSHEKETTPYE